MRQDGSKEKGEMRSYFIIATQKPEQAGVEVAFLYLREMVWM
jgi:hypothetical protein